MQMRLAETKSVHFENYACHYFQVAARHTAHIQTHSLLFLLSTSFLLFADKCFMKDFSPPLTPPPPLHILSRNNVLWMCPRDYMWHSPQVSSSRSPTWAAWARPRQNLEGRGAEKNRGRSIFYHPKLTVKQCAQSKYYQRVYPFQMWKSKVGHTIHSL